MKNDKPFCFKCQKHVTAKGERCEVCNRVIFELIAKHHGEPLRTTDKMYRDLVRCR